MNRRDFLVKGLAAGALSAAGAGSAAPGSPSFETKVQPPVPRAKLAESLALACAWLTEVAQVKTGKLTIEHDKAGHLHDSWRGAIRGEYSAATRQWDFFGPVWHTGQAIKALVLASSALSKPELLAAAKVSAEFIGSARIADKGDPDCGLILAYEDKGDEIGTSGVLEACDGLFLLSQATGDERYAAWACAAAAWIADHAYIGQGMFRDHFAIRTRQWVPVPRQANRPGAGEGRPLFDDGIFLKVWKRTGEARMREIFLATAERLLAEEEPAGNWIRFHPCNPATGTIHPRHAYWWGRPFLAAYKETGQSRYLACAVRAGEWYLNAMRTDGGLFRDTRRDFKTPSFGHETSGICCAMILWRELWQADGDRRWLAAADQALRYCMRGQFREPRDPNLRGAILEQVRPPDGTDASPYHLRDLGTIFYAQAVSGMLSLSPI